MNPEFAEVVRLLVRLTNARKAAWIRHPSPGTVFCFFDRQRIDIGVYGNGGAEVVFPDGEIFGLTLRIRHREYCIEHPASDFPELVELLRSAPNDPDVLRQMNLEATERLFEDLRRPLSDV